jgi:ElaB/YqjD/DUF883 family membrane-anchored ribosome-binding protein
MDTDKNTYETPKQQMAGKAGSGSTTPQNILERDTEAYGQAEKAVSDAYDKTAQKVSETYDKTAQKVSETYDKAAQKVGETYDKAKSYSNENPGKTILIALGIGVGLGLLLGASSRQSRTSRIAQPVINALSDIAHEFFR